MSMRYALFIYHNEGVSAKKSQQEQQMLMQDYNAFTGWLADSGNNLGGEALQATNTATTVRVRNGKTLNPSMNSGPHAASPLSSWRLHRRLRASVPAAPGASVGTAEGSGEDR